MKNEELKDLIDELVQPIKDELQKLKFNLASEEQQPVNDVPEYTEAVEKWRQNRKEGYMSGKELNAPRSNKTQPAGSLGGREV